ncbi:unnamed protein product [Paramecium sonneborni]|uniref:Uncharacterized protein n=1 Tax=Paramecium sonneborni TaxID=65129 RepID=A0A8S1M3T6_9CILI|nr:unnamed protein product [Paramecium sonneborni]
MHNYSFTQDYNDNSYLDWNDQNYNCFDHYLNPVIDNQVLIKVEENDVDNKEQLSIQNQTKQQKKKQQLNFSKRKTIKLKNHKQIQQTIIKRSINKYYTEPSNCLFRKATKDPNNHLQTNMELSSKITSLNSIKWKFDFIATLIKQTTLEMIQLQQYRNDKQLL